MQPSNTPPQQLDAKIPPGLFNREANQVRGTVMDTLRVLGIGQSWTFHFHKAPELEYAKALVGEFERRNPSVEFVTEDHAPKGGFHYSHNKDYSLAVTKCMKGASINVVPLAPKVRFTSGNYKDRGKNSRDRRGNSPDRKEGSEAEGLEQASFRLNLDDRITTGERQNEVTDFITQHLSDCLNSALQTANLLQVGELIYSVKVKINRSSRFAHIEISGIDESSEKELRDKLVGTAEDGYNLNKLEKCLLDELSKIHARMKIEWDIPDIELEIAGFRREREFNLFSKIRDAIVSSSESVTVTLYSQRERHSLGQILHHLNCLDAPASSLRFECKGIKFPCDAYLDLSYFNFTGEIKTPKWLISTECKLTSGDTMEEETEKGIQERKEG